MPRKPPWSPLEGVRPVDGPAGPPPAPIIKQVLAPAVGAATYRVLSAEVLFYWTHFLDGRTGPHFEPVENCPGCRALRKPRRYGYLAVSPLDRDLALICQVTDRGMWNSPSLTKYNGCLRGRRLRMWRDPKYRGRPQAPAAYVVSDDVDPATPPPLFHLAKHLLILWGYSRQVQEWESMGRPATWGQVVQAHPEWEGVPPGGLGASLDAPEGPMPEDDTV